MHKPNSTARALTPLLLLTLVSGCASVSRSSLPVVVQPAEIPQMPEQAMQPDPPEICLPSCSSGLTTLRTQLLDMLTPPE